MELQDSIETDDVCKIFNYSNLNIHKFIFPYYLLKIYNIYYFIVCTDFSKIIKRRNLG